MRARRPSHDPAVVGALVACTLSGCAEWPLWSHLPDEGDGIEAPDDVRDLVEREWFEVIEGDDLPDSSVGVFAYELGTEEALLIEGTLVGTGWNDLAAPIVVTAPGCDEVGAPRHPEVIPGEWIGDVDVGVVTAAAGGTLCAELETERIGWDLLLSRVDACGVPESFAEGDDGPLGWNRGGRSGRWSAPIEPGVAYAVTLGGYWPTEPEGEVPWRLGLSVVTPASDGEALCPNLPEAAP